MSDLYWSQQGGGGSFSASTLPPPPPRGDLIGQLRAATYSSDKISALEAISERPALVARHARYIAGFLSDSLVRKAALKALRRLQPEELQPHAAAVAKLLTEYDSDLKVSALTCLIPVLRYEHFTGNLKDVLQEQLTHSDAGVRAVAEHILTMWQRDAETEPQANDAAQAALAEADARAEEAGRRATIADAARAAADARAEEAELHAAAVENETAETERRAVDAAQAARAEADEDIAALTAQIEELKTDNNLLKGYIGEDPASYTEGGNVRFMQWNLQDLTNVGEVQGQLWEERRDNIVNTIRFYKPDVVAIEEVKAGDGGRAAFNQIVGCLRQHGYVGKYSDPVNPGAGGKIERVGLIWRTRLANADALTFNLLVNVNGVDGRANAEDENTVAAAATRIGLDVQETVNACASAFQEPLPSGTSKSHFDRHLVLATLQTNLGQSLHVLIGHLDTGEVHGTDGNTAEVNVIKELASRAWAAGAWLFVMADTNTFEAGNRGIWGADDDRTIEFTLRGRRALPSGLPSGRPTNVYPHQYATQTEDETIKAKPKRNDEIFFPNSWERVSAKTARMSPAALGAWAPAASEKILAAEEDPSQRRGLGANINKQLTLRWSDHLAVIAEVRLLGT